MKTLLDFVSIDENQCYKQFWMFHEPFDFLIEPNWTIVLVRVVYGVDIDTQILVVATMDEKQIH